MTTYDAFEFSRFMADYLKTHPHVLDDQQRGWDFYWNPWLVGGSGGAAVDGAPADRSGRPATVTRPAPR